MIVEVGPVGSRLIDCKIADLEYLRSIFKIENSYMARQMSNHKIPRFKPLINERGNFLTGLIDDVLDVLDQKGIDYELQDKRVFPELPDDEHMLAVLENMPFKLRKYQKDCVFAVLEAPQGIVGAATGAGKSIVMCASIFMSGFKTIVVVGKLDLAYQLREEFAQYMGLDVDEIGMIGDGIFQPRQVTVCIINSLTANTRSSAEKKKNVAKFLESVEAIYIDEAHNAQSDLYRKLVKKCKNTCMRYGFSATATTSKVRGEFGKVKNDLMLTELFGRVIFSIKTVDLINKGYLARPIVNIIQNKIDSDDEVMQYAFEYEKWIVKNHERNYLICSLINKHLKNGEKVVGYVDRILHGTIIRDMLIDDFGVDPEEVAFVSGDIDKGSRLSYIKEFKDGDSTVRVLLGTVLNEGLNFQVDVGINISGGTSEKTAIQRVGRILRKKRSSTGDVSTDKEEVVTYYDFADRRHVIFVRQGTERSKVYKSEGHEVLKVKIDDILKGDGE